MPYYTFWQAFIDFMFPSLTRSKSFQMRGYGEYMVDKKRIDRTEAKDLDSKGLIISATIVNTDICSIAL